MFLQEILAGRDIYSIVKELFHPAYFQTRIKIAQETTFESAMFTKP